MARTPTHLRLDLPWPPSINRYYRNIKGRTLISREGREYRKRVIAILASTQGLGDIRLFMELFVYPPDRRKRDLDNLVKPLQDALQHAKMFDDDGQIDGFSIWRKSPVDGGVVNVYLEPFNA